MQTLQRAGKVFGWTILGGTVAGLIGFAIAILLDIVLGLSKGGGDPATRGLSSAALIIELLFVVGIFAGMVAGCAYGIVRGRKASAGGK